jgi:tetratricopeptide (TPR) repeat protein
VEEAYARLEALRKAPLVGPGAYVRRMERLRTLAAEALAIHAKSPAAGEDLHRMAEICTDGERFAEAAECAAKYLASPPAPAPAPASGAPLNAGHAHSLLVRALAKTGKLAEADAAFKAYREAFPKGDGLAPALKSVGDGFVAAGRIPEALERYHAALELHPRPLRAGAAATVQAYCETLVALGRVAEAHRAAQKAIVDTPDREVQVRLRAVLRRAETTGEAPGNIVPEIWLGATGPTPESLRGKVVVWHFFAWWMQKGTEEIDSWYARAPELAAKGIVFLPVTRTSGFDPETETQDPGKVTTEQEAASVEKFLKARGWKGPVGLSVEGKLFTALRIRGVPTEIVVGRDGKVIFVRGGSEGGSRLTVFAAERAATEAPPAPAPAPGEEKDKEGKKDDK